MIDLCIRPSYIRQDYFNETSAEWLALSLSLVDDTSEVESHYRAEINSPTFSCVRISLYTQGVSGGIVNILGGGSMDYSE